MPTYSIFGSSLHSEIALPELRPTRKSGAQWALRVAHTPLSLDGAELLGTETVIPGVDVRLYRVPGGYRLVYDDTGRFDISSDGREIVWSKGPNAWLGAARLDIINRVLPVALHAAGMLCLHGSAVSMSRAAIAFLAPRHYGKSTLALAMADVGARILTDDLLAVEPQAPVIARPGVHSVRLLDDAARAVVGDADTLKAVGAYPLQRRDLKQLSGDQPVVTKRILRGLPARKLMVDPVPLAAIYILRPIRADGAGVAATRTAFPAVRAALALVEHAKSGALLRKSEAPVLFDRTVRVAREVAVYDLAVVRDLARIAEVAEQVAQWHQAPNMARS
jgi:hypothetical protein